MLEERIRGRQAEPEQELSAARWWFQHLEKVRVGDHVIDTDSSSARAVAAVMLQVTGWLS